MKELGETHGLRGLYLRNGPEFQVLYVTPDGRATIAGVMWDATGKNSTRDQVSKIDGAIPTVVVDKDGAKSIEAAARSDTLLSVEKASFGLAGDPAAPRLWMIIDPYCSYSVRAFDALRPYVKAGRIQLAVVPISILDYEDNGQSTPAAQSLLSQNSRQDGGSLGSPKLPLGGFRERPGVAREEQSARRGDRAAWNADARLAQGGWERGRDRRDSEGLGRADRRSRGGS